MALIQHEMLIKSHFDKFREDKKTLKEEEEFFKLVVLSIKMEKSQFILNKRLVEKDADEMFRRAKSEGVKFYQFYEWIEHEIRESMYILDKQPEFNIQINCEDDASFSKEINFDYPEIKVSDQVVVQSSANNKRKSDLAKVRQLNI